MKALILVSGWSGPGYEWLVSPIRTQAQWHDLKPICFKQDFNGLCYIQRNSLKLERMITSLARLPHCEAIFAVGHSMGGLIVREAASRLAPLDAYVTIGTPHRGAQAAVLAPSWAGSAGQMKCGSKYLENLSQECQHPHVKCIACKYDVLVNIKDSFEIGCESRATVNQGHMGALLSNECAQEVFNYLDAVELQAQYS